MAPKDDQRSGKESRSHVCTTTGGPIFMVNQEHVSFVHRLEYPARRLVGALLNKHGDLNGSLNRYWTRECRDPVVLLQVYQATQGRATADLYRAASIVIALCVPHISPKALARTLDRLAVATPQRVPFVVGDLLAQVDGSYPFRDILRAHCAAAAKAVLGQLPARRSPR